MKFFMVPGFYQAIVFTLKKPCSFYSEFCMGIVLQILSLFGNGACGKKPVYLFLGNLYCRLLYFSAICSIVAFLNTAKNNECLKKPLQTTGGL
jgi:hypothetical protein